MQKLIFFAVITTVLSVTYDHSEVILICWFEIYLIMCAEYSYTA